MRMHTRFICCSCCFWLIITLTRSQNTNPSSDMFIHNQLMLLQCGRCKDSVILKFVFYLRFFFFCFLFLLFILSIIVFAILYSEKFTLKLRKLKSATFSLCLVRRLNCMLKPFAVAVLSSNSTTRYGFGS